MPVGGDVIQLTHRMNMASQDILNVYHFEAVDGTADLSALASWFSTNVVPDVKVVQPDDVSHTALELFNLFDKGETYELGLSGTGGGTGEPLPHFCSASIRLRHPDTGVRSGYKRVGPCEEVNQATGVWSGAMVALFENIGDHLINPLSPVLATWAHVVVGRIKFIDPFDGKPKYRLPAHQGELTVGYPTSYEVSVNVTSQNSRKLWVGS